MPGSDLPQNKQSEKAGPLKSMSTLHLTSGLKLTADFVSSKIFLYTYMDSRNINSHSQSKYTPVQKFGVTVLFLQ